MKHLVCEGTCPKTSILLRPTTIAFHSVENARRITLDLLSKRVTVAITPHAPLDVERRGDALFEIYRCTECRTKRIYGMIAPSNGLAS